MNLVEYAQAVTKAAQDGREAWLLQEFGTWVQHEGAIEYWLPHGYSQYEHARLKVALKGADGLTSSKDFLELSPIVLEALSAFVTTAVATIFQDTKGIFLPLSQVLEPVLPLKLWDEWRLQNLVNAWQLLRPANQLRQHPFQMLLRAASPDVHAEPATPVASK
ncbi:hypothetical protein OIO90_000691 [Microbotryomycetes sp. JL221]|nr:hypothetical protein OIO90_000691 [Microbotryomycetes sp. JL221]